MHVGYRASKALREGKAVRSQRPRIEGQKWCPDCGAYLEVGAFGQNKASYDKLTGYCRPHQNTRSKRSIERLHGTGRHYHLVRRYGVSAADVDHMIEQQHGLCPVCERDLGNKPHVDHDHDTDAVRQVLCFTCNGGLGLFGDDPARLRSAAAYVETHRGVATAPATAPAITLSVEQVGVRLYYAFSHGLGAAAVRSPQ